MLLVLVSPTLKSQFQSQPHSQSQSRSLSISAELPFCEQSKNGQVKCKENGNCECKHGTKGNSSNSSYLAKFITIMPKIIAPI